MKDAPQDVFDRVLKMAVAALCVIACLMFLVATGPSKSAMAVLTLLVYWPVSRFFAGVENRKMQRAFTLVATLLVVLAVAFCVW
jgi:hypothetical protein